MSAIEKYGNKLFSVLGDSISTLEGYSVPSYAVFYDGAYRLISDVMHFGDTWWGNVIDRLGGELLMNNSISGSMVTMHPDCEIPSFSSSEERTSSLSKDGITPDVIMIFMGINDWGYAMKISKDEGTRLEDISFFAPAYGRMLELLKKNYPSAEIWCLTLPVSRCDSDKNFVFSFSIGGRHIERYNEVIREAAAEYGCRLIELYDPSSPHDTIDGFHPTADGMRAIADRVIMNIEDTV